MNRSYIDVAVLSPAAAITLREGIGGEIALEERYLATECNGPCDRPWARADRKSKTAMYPFYHPVCIVRPDSSITDVTTLCARIQVEFTYGHADSLRR
ncbi:MAG TPA: hypothetical protein VGI81_01830 [Tepidisphaeraceae bacterium]